MATTRLSVTATPGRRFSFAPKTEAPAAPKGAGPFTTLGVMGAPARRRTFAPKDPAPAISKGVGQFTSLSAMATPGRIREYLAKTAAEVIPEIIPEVVPEAPPIDPGGMGGLPFIEMVHLDRLKHREDQEILEIIIQAILSEILN